MRRRRQPEPPSLDDQLMEAYRLLDEVWRHPDMPNGGQKAEIAMMQMTLLDIWEKRRRPEPTTGITCPRCGRTSYHPMDKANGYCGYCHWWTSDPVLGRPDVITAAERDGTITPL